jgi:hypothetical protein
MEEERFIDNIRKGQEALMDKFFEMKLVETSLTAVKKIYDEKKYDALSGEEFMDMFRELQRKGKQN